MASTAESSPHLRQACDMGWSLDCEEGHWIPVPTLPQTLGNSPVLLGLHIVSSVKWVGRSLKSGPWISSVSIIWKRARNAKSQAPAQTWRICAGCQQDPRDSNAQALVWMASVSTRGPHLGTPGTLVCTQPANTSANVLWVEPPAATTPSC